jgi:putative flippase GtrA
MVLCGRCQAQRVDGSGSAIRSASEAESVGDAGAYGIQPIRVSLNDRLSGKGGTPRSCADIGRGWARCGAQGNHPKTPRAAPAFLNNRISVPAVWRNRSMSQSATFLVASAMAPKTARTPLAGEIARFALVGVINTGVDLVVLNALIAISHRGRTGLLYSLFKAISFLVAVLNSYFLNSQWTFRETAPQSTMTRVGRFLSVSIVGLAINVGTASGVVMFVGPVRWLARWWPSVAALAGATCGLAFNFAGYKYLVFLPGSKRGADPILMPTDGRSLSAGKRLQADLWGRHEPLHWNKGSAENMQTRSGTRVPCEIPVALTGVDSTRSFSESCVVILVNPQGCAVRFHRPLEVGSAVRLEGLPSGNQATARVVNCISIGGYEKLWLLGLALDKPGNVWGIQNPPQDWVL